MNMILQAIFNHGHKQNLDTAIIIDGVEHTYKDLYDDIIAVSYTHLDVYKRQAVKRLISV